MVTGVCMYFPAAHQIKPRVIGMRPVGDVVLHDAGNQGCAWRVLQLVRIAKIENGVMRIEHRLLQKHERIANGRFGLVLKGFDE